MSVAARLAAIRDHIEAAGRDPAEITIVAVTKGQPGERCREAVAAGLRILGENRVQEALAKMEEVRGAEWHLIGHLQRNKVRHAVGRFTLVQSVDSRELAAAISRRRREQPVLLEVNVAREAQKYGADPSTAVQLAREVSGLVDLRGLMAMGPARGDPAPAFRELRRLRDDAEQACGRSLPVLSMGMTGDYPAALAAGSTMLRLGRALFGS